MFLLTKSINVEVSDTYRTQMVMIEASRAIYIFEVHPEVVLPAEEIMVTIEHFHFVIRHSQVPSMQIEHLRA